MDNLTLKIVLLPHNSFESNNRINLNKHLKAEHKGNKSVKNSGINKSPSVPPKMSSSKPPPATSGDTKVKCPKCPYSVESSLVGRHLEGAHGGVACEECKWVAESRDETRDSNMNYCDFSHY